MFSAVQVEVVLSSTDWGEIASLIVAGAAVAVAIISIWSTRVFQTQEALQRLLESFEAGEFATVMWRVEMYTLRDGGRGTPPDWPLDPITVDECRDRLNRAEKLDGLALFDRAIGRDDGIQKVDMRDTYFFALRIHAWLYSNRFWPKGHKTRLLNGAFGYQLVRTFLDHWIVARRLRTPKRHDAYFAEQWGLSDSRYVQLVERLYKDLMQPRSQLPRPIGDALAIRWTRLHESET